MRVIVGDAATGDTAQRLLHRLGSVLQGNAIAEGGMLDVAQGAGVERFVPRARGEHGFPAEPQAVPGRSHRLQLFEVDLQYQDADGSPALKDRGDQETRGQVAGGSVFEKGREVGLQIAARQAETFGQMRVAQWSGQQIAAEIGFVFDRIDHIAMQVHQKVIVVVRVAKGQNGVDSLAQTAIGRAVVAQARPGIGKPP